MPSLRALVCILAVTSTACGSSDSATTSPPAVLGSVTLSPAPGTVTVGNTLTLAAAALDANGASFSGAQLAFASSDQTKATVDGSGVVTGVAVGTTTITVTATSGSISKTASSQITVSPTPSAFTVTTGPASFQPPAAAVAKGGIVTWSNNAGVTHNVTFDNAGSPANISPLNSGSTGTATFPAAGTFPYHCTIHAGMTGTITVKP
jgi:plastocyanin